MAPLARFNCARRPRAGIAGAGSRWVLIRDPLGQLQTQAMLCTETSVDPIQVVQWFALRWRVEVAFQEVRVHLGVETQRQWSDRAVARTTPLLLGLFSWVTLAAKLLQQECPSSLRTASWYNKTEPTFIDAIALVRRHLWLGTETLSTSRVGDRCGENPSATLRPSRGVIGLRCLRESTYVQSRGNISGQNVPLAFPANRVQRL